MSRQVRFTKRADKSFDKILDYLKGAFGDLVCEKFKQRVFSFESILAEHPNIGRAADTDKSIYSFVIEKTVTVYYRFDDHKVVVLKFFTTTQDPKKRLE